MKTSQTVSKVAIGTSVGVSSIVAVVSSSSSNSVFSSLNQFQLYMLIPLVGTFVHQDVLDYIAGFEFSSFSIDLLDYKKIMLLNRFVDMFNFEIHNYYLYNIGIASTSTIRNILSVVIVCLLFAIVHLAIIIPLNRCAKSKSSESKCRKFINKAVSAFTFSVYLRLLIESYQLMVISSANEIYSFDIGTTPKLASFMIT